MRVLREGLDVRQGVKDAQFLLEMFIKDLNPETLRELKQHAVNWLSKYSGYK